MREQSTIIRRGALQINSFVTVILALARTQDVLLTWGDVKKERSDLQNRALWGCAYKTLRDATGNDPEDLHTYFCGEFWSWIEYDVMGQKRKRPWRTTTKDENGHRDVISTQELSAFYSFIQLRAAETVGVYVPDPDPMWWSHQQKVA